MKFEAFSLKGSREARQHHEPLRTIKELADEFGISHMQLVADMRWSPVRPPPVSLRTHGSAGNQTWYPYAAMRRWRRAHLESINTTTPISSPAPASSPIPQAS